MSERAAWLRRAMKQRDENKNEREGDMDAYGKAEVREVWRDRNGFKNGMVPKVSNDYVPDLQASGADAGDYKLVFQVLGRQARGKGQVMER